MGSIFDPPPSAVIAESRAYKEASALDPRGVEFVDQLTLPERPFQVFWEDSTGIHRAAPVGCWWNHYRFGWQTDDHREQSELRFIIPREMVVAMQTRYANEFRSRFFGDPAKHQLDQEFLPSERVDMTDGPYSDPGDRAAPRKSSRQAGTGSARHSRPLLPTGAITWAARAFRR